MKYTITYSKVKHWWIKLLPDLSFKLTIPLKKSKDKSFEKLLLEKWMQLLEKHKKSGIKTIKPLNSDSVLVFWEKVFLSDIKWDLEIYLKQCLYEVWLPIMNKVSLDLWINYNKFYVKNLKTKWGSCSWIQNISIWLNLVHLPIKFLNYVIIHECCHLKEKNHGKNFWNLVEKYCLDYKEIRKELKKYRFE